MNQDLNKLRTLAESYGTTQMQMLEDATFGCVAPGICMNEHCDYTTDVEPDQDRGWCEICETNTVKSCLILAGII